MASEEDKVMANVAAIMRAVLERIQQANRT